MLLQALSLISGHGAGNTYCPFQFYMPEHSSHVLLSIFHKKILENAFLIHDKPYNWLYLEVVDPADPEMKTNIVPGGRFNQKHLINSQRRGKYYTIKNIILYI